MYLLQLLTIVMIEGPKPVVCIQRDAYLASCVIDKVAIASVRRLKFIKYELLRSLQTRVFLKREDEERYGIVDSRTVAESQTSWMQRESSVHRI